MANLGIAQSEITGAGSGSGGSSFNFRGQWLVGTAYATNDVVTQLGSVYVAIQGNTGSNPYFDSTQTNWKLFTQGFNYAGTWASGTNYNFFDVVTFNNSFYLSVVPGEQSNIGNNPQTDTPTSPNPRYAQSVTASGTTNPLPSPSITFTTGSLVLVVVIVGNSILQFATAVTDGLGNTYQRLPNTQAQNINVFSGGTTEIWYAFNVNGGTTTVQAHAGFGGYGEITVLEYKDMLTSSLVIDQSSSASGSAVNTVTLPTTTQAKELIFVAFFETTGGASTPSGYTPRTPAAGNVYDQFVSVVGGYTASTGNSGQYIASMASFVDQTPSSHWVLLDQGFNFRGTWSSIVTYQPYDVVSFNSSSYVSQPGILNNLNNPPNTSPANWALLAQAGLVATRQTEVFMMPTASITSVQVTSNVVTLSVVNTFSTQGLAVVPATGQVNTVYITGLTNATFLNGQVLTVTSVSGTAITANFTHTNYGPTAETSTNNIWVSIPINGIYWTTIPLGKTFALSYITCAQANRIELYSTAAARTADSGRPATTQPTQFTQHGVILDLNLDGVQASFSSWVLSPLAYGANLDGLPYPPASGTVNINAALTNIAGSPTTNLFQIVFIYTFEEQ
jgi:hypothetical protein